MLYYTIAYYNVLYYTILYDTILYDTILVIIYYTILHYTTLYQESGGIGIQCLGLGAFPLVPRKPVRNSRNQIDILSSNSPRTQYLQTKNLPVQMSGELPRYLGVPPLKSENLTESSPDIPDS